MFFDRYPRFLTTSEVANNSNRLNLRHEAIFGRHADLLEGARVLDIASHDGRWTMAALDAGAAHVVGVEARPELVEAAGATFAEYGIDSARYRFEQADVFDHLARREPFDVVLCLGFLYHTLRFTELLSGIRATGARHVVVDTRTIPDESKHVRIVIDHVEKQGHAVADPFGAPGAVVTGTPSRPALARLFEVYGYRVLRRIDWQELVKEHSRGGVAAYLEDRRVTWSFERDG